MKALILTITAAATAAASADVLLHIDVTDPNDVLISSSGAMPAADVDLFAIVDGVTLQDLLLPDYPHFPFTTLPPPDGVAFSTSTLTTSLAAGADPTLSQLVTFEWDDNTGIDKAANDVSLYRGGGGGFQIGFDSDQPAFVGSARFDFAGNGAVLPSIGTSGTIRAGFLQNGGHHGVILGEWLIVPAPGSIALTACGICASLRRRR